ncbi:copper homeostasis protein CutC [Acetobacter nitrogenifigens DSM 23921 = NBRC 105050]|uniref:PF03932 family protein CutC n=1 Tax=Acetobacter nitrogenifigens DSM 23921 = NBRC 105050 TaxID=1120919 RepID=A0A511XBM9_9PROT|nr:copper homeostasis protein CutC [Acetobacter nitrogenifigens]GBQ88373.1 copper homeostasis protein CutC [Acetobacter nitrogenifigens DSM 23921 = NBRC 105050]GEN60383.1 copper homeostasis protein CutC [Acetobacter nitrogenifigens DSM 23921 = NBRC 105050]
MTAKLVPGLEVCVDSIGGLRAAWEGEADRIELCAALSLGGLTPSPGLLAVAAQGATPVYVMIRPRGGDFVFSVDEEATMRRDIDAVAAAFAQKDGAVGVVLGASLADGRLDVPCLESLLQHARSVGLSRATLHRAFDLTPDPAEALEQAIGLGFERVLTSGCAKTARDGAEILRMLCEQAGDRISVMAGGGLTSENVAEVIAATGVMEVHASCRGPAPQEQEDGRVLAFGFGARPGETDAGRVRAMRSCVMSTARNGE